MSENEDWIRRAERRMLTYRDLIGVTVKDNGERMVELTPSPQLLVDQRYPEMQEVTGDRIFVRESVKYMLGSACLNLARKDKSLQLQVVYGYRSLEIQKRDYEEEKRKLQGLFTGIDLTEATHRRIAEPTVAGHPTGGAVDVQLARNGVPLLFGTEIRTFTHESYVACPASVIGDEAFGNREVLRKIMLDVGFAPFDGEWWHFSYGDREWAKSWGKPRALYEQVEFSA